MTPHLLQFRMTNSGHALHFTSLDLAAAAIDHYVSFSDSLPDFYRRYNEVIVSNLLGT